MPPTPEARPGYAFNGWTLRVVAAPEPVVPTLSQVDTSADGTTNCSVPSDNGEESCGVAFDYGTVMIAATKSLCPSWGGYNQCDWWMGTCENCCCSVTGFTPANGTLISYGGNGMNGMSDGENYAEVMPPYGNSCTEYCAHLVATSSSVRNTLYSSAYPIE